MELENNMRYLAKLQRKEHKKLKKVMKEVKEVKLWVKNKVHTQGMYGNEIYIDEK